MTCCPEKNQKLLLHACCGPCSLEPTRIVRSEGWDPTIFYANSNIHPAAEYRHRLETLQAWAAEEGVPVVEGVYDPARWEEAAGRTGDAAVAKAEAAARAGDAAAAGDVAAAGDAGDAGDATAAEAPNAEAFPILQQDPQARMARCRACYRLRFEEAAAFAKEHGFTHLGTTLSVSPYQYTQVIREELERACAHAGLTPHFEDYRPFYEEATRRSRALGMYRQNFCGCRISEAEAEAERAQRKAQRRAVKAEHDRAHAAERAEEQAALAAKRAEKAAYAEKQRRKKAALKALRQAAAERNTTS